MEEDTKEHRRSLNQDDAKIEEDFHRDQSERRKWNLNNYCIFGLSALAVISGSLIDEESSRNGLYAVSTVIGFMGIIDRIVGYHPKR